MKNIKFFLGALSFIFVQKMHAQDILAYKNYDFIAGEKIVFEDNYFADNVSSSPTMWNIEEGKVAIIKENDEKYISVLEYYTKFSPKLKNLKVLPDTFTIEYDTWLDAGYDGNPGIEIHLTKGEQDVVITPNKHVLTVSYPGGDRESKENPPEYFGENKFYNRWVHISIAYINKRVIVYLDEYKQIDLVDCKLKPTKILVTGNTSGDLKILFKNFKLAKNIPSKAFELKNGKFITHAIKFDVNKAIVKSESMVILKEIVNYLKTNTTVNFEIGGYTDSDGDDASNLKLSEERARAVKDALISLGVNSSQLTSKGYGEAKPVETNLTLEGKAANRRVEFVKSN